MPEPILSLTGFSTRINARLATAPVDLRLMPGSAVVVRTSGSAVGARLLRAAAGLATVATGVRVVSAIRTAYVFEDGGLLANLSLAENVALPLRFRGLPEGAVADSLRRFGLGHLADARPSAVGTEARVLTQFARATALEVELLYAERPFAGLSELGVQLVEHWFAAHLDAGMGVLLTATDPTLAPGIVVLEPHPTLHGRTDDDS